MKKCSIQITDVDIFEFGMLNEFIEDSFEHVEAEYHYDAKKDTGIARIYSSPKYKNEFIEAVQLLILIMNAEV